MTTEEILETICKVMRQTKTKWLATNPVNPDLAIYLHFFRDGELVATAQTPLNRDTALQAMALGGQGMGATVISFTCESYETASDISPYTGQPWAARERQFIFETKPDQTEVTECLTTTVVDATGKALCTVQPFRINSGELEWLEEMSAGNAGGLIAETLTQILQSPKLADLVNEKLGGDLLVQIQAELGAERSLFHQDMAVWRALLGKELISSMIIEAKPGTLRYDMLQERLGEPDLFPELPL